MSLYDALLILKGIGEHTQNKIQMQNIYEGNLLAAILNTTPRKSRKVFRWTDFYPDLKENTEKMTNEEIADKLHSMFGNRINTNPHSYMSSKNLINHNNGRTECR